MDSPLIEVYKNGKVTAFYLDTAFYNGEPNFKFVKHNNKMKTAIGVKLIAYVAMSRLAYNELRGWTVPEDENPSDEGYLVNYIGQEPNTPHYDGYVSWSPKEIFEASYFPIEVSDKISKSDVDAFIVKGKGQKIGEKTCVVLDSTLTGFDTTGTSACVDPANYNQEIGEEIARKDIVNAIWGHLGFVLQWAKNGLTGNTGYIQGSSTDQAPTINIES